MLGKVKVKDCLVWQEANAVLPLSECGLLGLSIVEFQQFLKSLLSLIRQLVFVTLNNCEQNQFLVRIRINLVNGLGWQ